MGERRWTIYVCSECGGVGQNNLSLHLPYTAARLAGLREECSPDTVDEVEVAPVSDHQAFRDSIAEEIERLRTMAADANEIADFSAAAGERAYAWHDQADRLQALLDRSNPSPTESRDEALNSPVERSDKSSPPPSTKENP